MDKVQAGNASAVVTIIDDEIYVDGKPVNTMSEDMVKFCGQMRHIDYIRYSMVQFTWELIETFLPEHPVHDVLTEVKATLEPTLGQVLCK